jgi:hypothetical protein
MMSTIEAIYYAAFEVLQQKCDLFSNSRRISQSNIQQCITERDNLVHLLWIFGHQRAATIRSARKNGQPAPCTREGKEKQRELRKTIGTEKHLKDIEMGKVLKEECRRKRDKQKTERDASGKEDDNC